MGTASEGKVLITAPNLSTDVTETNSPFRIGAGPSVHRFLLSASLEELSRPQGDSSGRFLGKLWCNIAPELQGRRGRVAAVLLLFINNFFEQRILRGVAPPEVQK